MLKIFIVAQNNYLVTFLILIIMVSFASIKALILSGGRESFARYPKWAQTFENEIKFEFKTYQSNAIILYTDDGELINYLIINFN
uniref:Uncharacterized protein n=1 Tax=Meloidogyne enterolobii TaxID=390850 RepID=A0A6V7Y1B9_MELEN|nr:unnamed protein product [Meloidogyne enterolobii]